MSDPSEVRSQQRDRWEAAAPGWEQRAATVASAGRPVAEWLVAAVDLQPGQRVLEVAGGLGDVGMLAAETVGEGGHVLITDGAGAMVEAAARRVALSDLPQVSVEQMEAEWLDSQTASFDAVLSRWGYMLVVDPEAALSEARRVLVGGGKIALAAWTALDQNPWMAAPRALFEELELIAPPPPGAPDPFRFGEPGIVGELLLSAGFIDVNVEAIELVWRAPSLDQWWEHMRLTSSVVGRATTELSPAQHYELRGRLDEALAPFVAADGAVALPGRSWVASAEV